MNEDFSSLHISWHKSLNLHTELQRIHFSTQLRCLVAVISTDDGELYSTSAHNMWWYIQYSANKYIGLLLPLLSTGNFFVKLFLLNIWINTGIDKYNRLYRHPIGNVNTDSDCIQIKQKLIKKNTCKNICKASTATLWPYQ